MNKDMGCEIVNFVRPINTHEFHMTTSHNQIHI
jgi:hypothetical protein